MLEQPFVLTHIGHVRDVHDKVLLQRCHFVAGLRIMAADQPSEGPQAKEWRQLQFRTVYSTHILDS